MKSAFGVEHVSKSYLGAGKWGRAVEVGAKKLRQAGSHSGARGVTPEDAEQSRRLHGAWKEGRSIIAGTGVQPVRMKGRNVYAFHDESPASGYTMQLPPKPGQSQRKTDVIVKLPEKLGNRADRRADRDMFKWELTQHAPNEGKTKIARAARNFAGTTGFKSTERHELVHALKHRKPASFQVRVNKKPKALWGEEARADSVMSRSMRQQSGYREMSRSGLAPEDYDLGRMYSDPRGPMRYRQVERQLKLVRKPRTFAVDSSGTATRGKSKAN